MGVKSYLKLWLVHSILFLDVLKLQQKNSSNLLVTCHYCFPGKIAIIGGCREYTGAPYFAAISALKVVSIF